MILQIKDLGDLLVHQTLITHMQLVLYGMVKLQELQLQHLQKDLDLHQQVYLQVVMEI